MLSDMKLGVSFFLLFCLSIGLTAEYLAAFLQHYFQFVHRQSCQ